MVTEKPMPRRQAFRSVLHNFLEPYTSRYTDYQGYWLFGLLIDKFERLEFDLLAVDEEVSERLIAAAASLAAVKLREQLGFAGVSMSCIRTALLTITKSPDTVEDQINGRLCRGYMTRFVVRVVSDHDRAYECEKTVFIAPHDPTVEYRSGRWQDAEPP